MSGGVCDLVLLQVELDDVVLACALLLVSGPGCCLAVAGAIGYGAAAFAEVEAHVAG